VPFRAINFHAAGAVRPAKYWNTGYISRPGESLSGAEYQYLSVYFPELGVEDRNEDGLIVLPKTGSRGDGVESFQAKEGDREGDEKRAGRGGMEWRACRLGLELRRTRKLRGEGALDIGPEFRAA